MWMVRGRKIGSKKRNIERRRHKFERGYVGDTPKREYKILNSVLAQFDIPTSYFSIGGYGEEAVCIEYEKGKWVVYIGERGNRYEEQSFRTFKEACRKVIEHLGENDIKKRRMEVVLNGKMRSTQKRIRMISQSTKLNTDLEKSGFIICSTKHSEKKKELKKDSLRNNNKINLLRIYQDK